MFTFIVQFVDLFRFGTVGLFFVFFVLSWAIYLFKLYTAHKYCGFTPNPDSSIKSVSVLLPVVDEAPEVWAKTLDSILLTTKGLDRELIVIANGKKSEVNASMAKDLGFTVLRIGKADKRLAVAEGAKVVTKDITVILDSDTWSEKDSVSLLLQSFGYDDIGGAIPTHTVFSDIPVMRRISNWLEDLRFNVTVRGQSYYGAVSCLAGRMMAIRTDLLKQAMPEFLNQSFLGVCCVTGDDRFLTSWLLRKGYKTIYQPACKVYTDAPDTLGKFIKQRLRWSRSSFRETILSLSWVQKYPYMAFTTITDVLMRWLFFAVILTAILSYADIIKRVHYLHFGLPLTALLVLIGFCTSGLLRQIPHLLRKPDDLKYLPAFLFVTTFILTFVEWYGNLTCWKQQWMTRNTVDSDLG